MIGIALAAEEEERQAVAQIAAAGDAHRARRDAMTPEERRAHRLQQEKRVEVRVMGQDACDLEIAERLVAAGARHPDGGDWTPRRVRARFDELNEKMERAAAEFKQATAEARAMFAGARLRKTASSRARRGPRQRKSSSKQAAKSGDPEPPSGPDCDPPAGAA